MNRVFLRYCAGSALALCISVGAAHGQSLVPVSVGPDVLVGDLPDLTNYTGTTNDNGFTACAVGTTSCNKGDLGFNWFTGGTDNRHPVIGQNLFRLHNGRFEQIGQAWLKHGFTALQGNVCANSNNFSQTACTSNPSGGVKLGVGCSDPYGSSLNGSQSGLGPKWQVNAANGLFPYPFAAATGACCNNTTSVCTTTTSGGCASGSTFKGTGSVCTPSPCGVATTAATGQRLRFRLSDVNATTYAGALYFVEGQYVGADDAASGYKTNNSSYRSCTVSGAGAVALSGTVVRERPAVYAWQAADPTVTISTIDLAGDGMFILACKVTGPVSGNYTYEYALHNLNSNRCANSFTVPKAPSVTVTGTGFHDVEYHSGEPNAVDLNNPTSDDWVNAIAGQSVSWTGPAYSGTQAVYTMNGTTPFKVDAFTAGTGNDHTANVLRWGTMFNFRFTADAAPAAGRVQIGLWRPGTPTSLTMNIPTPGGAVIGTEPTGTCCNGTTCTVVTQAACNTDATGACCVATSCTVTTQAVCYGNFQGGGTSCSPTPCPSTTNIRFKLVNGVCSPNPCSEPARGACCTAAGACRFSTQANCGVEASGTYQGDGTTCQPNGCPVAGACCTGTSCTSVVQASCGGTFLGALTTCSPNPCSGSCCISGSCTVTTPGSCSGTYTAGGTCSPNPCSGSCCVGTSCTVVNTGSCSGTYTAGGTCSPNPCGGACCTAGNTCTFTANGSCSGTYLGNGTSCTPNPCNGPTNDLCASAVGLCDGVGVAGFTTLSTNDGTASCASSASSPDVWYYYVPASSATITVDTCTANYDTALAAYTGACGALTQIACDDDTCGSLHSRISFAATAGTRYTIRVAGFNSATGTFTVTVIGGTGGSCNPVTGACCVAGVCTSTTQAACTGTWTSGGSCSPNPCPQPTGSCCNAATGGCTSTTQAACTGTWTQGGSCSPNPCPQPTGACCCGSNCSITTSAACTGSWVGASSACTPFSATVPCCRGDYNKSGATSVQDIFDFLAGYFANALCADSNDSGAISVQDIFDFLAAYFGGC